MSQGGFMKSRFGNPWQSAERKRNSLSHRFIDQKLTEFVILSEVEGYALRFTQSANPKCLLLMP